MRSSRPLRSVMRDRTTLSTRRTSACPTVSIASCRSPECLRGCCFSLVSSCCGTTRPARPQWPRPSPTGRTTAASTRSSRFSSRRSMAFLLIFFGAGLRRRLERGSGDSGHGTVAFGGAASGCRDLRARRDARSRDDECGARGEPPSRLHAQPAPLVRLAGVERSLRSDAARNRPRRAPQSDAARPRSPGRRSSSERRSSRRSGSSGSSSFRCG